MGAAERSQRAHFWVRGDRRVFFPSLWWGDCWDGGREEPRHLSAFGGGKKPISKSPQYYRGTGAERTAPSMVIGKAGGCGDQGAMRGGGKSSPSSGAASCEPKGCWDPTVATGEGGCFYWGACS